MKPQNLIRIAICLVALLVCSTWLLASGGAWLTDDPPQYSDWSAPVNLGSTINFPNAWEYQVAISPDGLSLYFDSDRPGGYGKRDIWVSQRASVDEPWGTPQNLGPNINTPSNDSAPFVSLDGHRLYFHSNRPGGFGGADIYVSRRHNKRDDFGWQPAENIGSGVNTSAQEQQPCVFEDDVTGIVTLYFNSNRPGGPGGDDIYASELQSDETFGSAALVLELNTPGEDSGPSISRDGLEMFFSSDRSVNFGHSDLWVATRPSTADPWSAPVNLGPVVNGIWTDGGPAISFDGTELYFISVDPTVTSFDIYVTTRSKLNGNGSN